MRLIGLVMFLVAACSPERVVPERVVAERAPVATSKRVPTHVTGESNIARADYIGPEACGECHAKQYALWSTSLHRVMNARVTDPGAMVGDFSGKRVPYRSGTATFDKTLGGFAMTLRDGDREVRYRVTRTIGHRGLQEYVGVEEPTARDDAKPRGQEARGDGADPRGKEARGDEVRLPFGWWPRGGGWMPQVAFDPWLSDAEFDPFTPVRDAWAERCPWCHSTYPMAQRIARASGPREVGHGLEQFFTSAAGSDRLAVDEQVTTGISCESCHLGGRAHADGAAISVLPSGAQLRPDAPAFPTTFAAQRRDARVVNTICAQCHSGPSPRLSDGTALRNSSEALDLAASPCNGIKCTDCHDPHAADSHGDEPRALAACVHCHTPLADEAAARAHAGPGHVTTSCLDCHMPRMVMGIDHYVRTHRISSPTDPKLIADAAPNACNLCHLDRPIAWTLDELRRGWDVKLAPKLAAYGDGERAVGEVWLGSKTAAIRLIAAHAYARSPLAAYVMPQLRAGLQDPVAYVRAWTKLAVDEAQRYH